MIKGDAQLLEIVFFKWLFAIVPPNFRAVLRGCPTFLHTYRKNRKNIWKTQSKRLPLQRICNNGTPWSYLISTSISPMKRLAERHLRKWETVRMWFASTAVLTMWYGWRASSSTSVSIAATARRSEAERWCTVQSSCKSTWTSSATSVGDDCGFVPHGLWTQGI